jgi:hypothetical protein
MYSWFRVTNRDKDYSKDFLVDLERFCNGRRLLAATIGTERYYLTKQLFFEVFLYFYQTERRHTVITRWMSTL